MKNVTLERSLGQVVIHESDGKGRPVVLVHGNSLSSESFTHQLSGEVGRRWRLVAFDLPGHGDSPPARDPVKTYCFKGYSTVLTEVVAALEIQRPVVVGHSLGGHVSFRAVADGLEPSGLFVFGTPPMGDPPDFPAAFHLDAIRDIMFRGDISKTEISHMAQLFMADGLAPPSYYARSIAATDPAARENLGLSMKRDKLTNEWAVLAALQCPVAIALGELDRVVSLSYTRGVPAPTLWRGAVQVIPGAGHCPEYDDHESFDRLLSSFLNKLPAWTPR